MRVQVALAAFLILACSCSSDPGDVDPDVDADAAIADAIEAMNDLESYRVRFATTLHPDDVRRETVWEFDVEPETDRYRYVLHSETGDSKEVCEFEGTGRTCRDVVIEVTDSSTFEGLYVDDFAYGRQCDAGGENCSEWERTVRPETPIFGPSPSYLPHWPIVALELIRDAGVLGASEVDGVVMVEITGNVNMARAILENQRRVLEPLGITTFSTECSGVSEPRGASTTAVTPEASPTLACHDLSFEEELKHQESVAEQDANPLQVDVWIGLDDGFLHRMDVGLDPQGGEATTMTVEYSDYNDVTIEVPEGFR